VPEPIRFYADQNIPGPVVEGLRRRGIDILTAQAAGRCGNTDPDQLSFATLESRGVVSFDPNFLEFHQSGAQHAGIAWCPARKYSIGDLIQVLVLIHAVMLPEEMASHVEYLYWLDSFQKCAKKIWRVNGG
jgi:hypothetical protein